MAANKCPGPIHIVSDGDRLHRLVLERLHANHGASMSIAVSPQAVTARGSRVKRWVRRQLDLDGIAGLIRAALSDLRPGIRQISSELRARRGAASDDGDQQFIDLISSGGGPLTAKAPTEVGTLITLGGLRCDIESRQRFDVHFGWPSHVGRDGVVAALSHRNVDALCTVIEATGIWTGFVLARPPLGIDDDPIRIYQRLVALGAVMIDDVLNDPEAILVPAQPSGAMSVSVVDHEAVRRDFSSGRMADIIRSISRF